LILRADEPEADFKVFQPRISGLEYSISHYGDHFYVLTNADGAENFKLMKTPVTATTKENWQELVAHRPEVLLEDILIFRDYLVLEERSNGLNQIRIHAWDGSADYYLPFQSETYTAYASVNPDFETHWLRYAYQSLATPASVIDYNMKTGERIV